MYETDSKSYEQIVDARLRKYPCTQCGAPTYRICYLSSKEGQRLVCVGCFGDACDNAGVRDALGRNDG